MLDSLKFQTINEKMLKKNYLTCRAKVKEGKQQLVLNENSALEQESSSDIEEQSLNERESKMFSSRPPDPKPTISKKVLQDQSIQAMPQTIHTEVQTDQTLSSKPPATSQTNNFDPATQIQIDNLTSKFDQFLKDVHHAASDRPKNKKVSQIIEKIDRLFQVDWNDLKDFEISRLTMSINGGSNRYEHNKTLNREFKQRAAKHIATSQPTSPMAAGKGLKVDAK